MGAAQSILCRKEPNILNIVGSQFITGDRQQNNMIETSNKPIDSNPPNSSNKILNKSKLASKFKNVKNKFNFKFNDTEKELNAKVNKSTKKDLYSPFEQQVSSEKKNSTENVSLFRWTLSSEIDLDLVSSFDQEPMKSISYEKFRAEGIRSLERLSPLSRLGAEIITTFKNSVSLVEAECQGLCQETQNVTITPKDKDHRYIPSPDKEHKMDLDLNSSRTSSTDLSEGDSSTKRQILNNFPDDASNKTAYVSTTATNVTNMSDEPSEKRSTITPDYNNFKNAVTCGHGHDVPKVENKVEIHEHHFRQNHNRDHDHKMACIPQCLKVNGINELFEKPSYNSLCTKCMHKEDKLPKGFKGMIIDIPNRKTEGKLPDKSPYLDRSNIVVQTALVDGKSIEQVYDINPDKLGKGSYGNVLKGVHKQTGATRAVKIIRKSRIENAMRMRREIQIMKSLDHPSIIKLFEVYEDLESLYLVMEMCTGGELFDRIVQKGSFSENYAAFIMRQVFSAIAYCHSKNVLHRDLKPENILYSNTTNTSPIKIIDWGFATKCFRTHKFTSLVGTPYYVAPEVLLGNYDKSCDIWSAGVILFILLVGYPPFHGSDNAEILKNVKRGWIKFIPKHWSHVSAAAKDLITRCLSYIPKKRITAEEALSHEWILKCTTLPPTVAPNVSKSLARRFRNFLKFNKLKQMALTCIAYHLSEKELAPLNSAFEALDRDGDGVLSLTEVANGLQPAHQSDSNIEKLVKGLDTDQSGIIEYTEFIAASIDTRLYNQNDFCKRAFNIFDTDGDGKITREDMFRVLSGKSTSVSLTHQMVDDILNEVDLDRDGTISYHEFYSMLYGWPEVTRNTK